MRRGGGESRERQRERTELVEERSQGRRVGAEQGGEQQAAGPEDDQAQEAPVQGAAVGDRGGGWGW